MSIKSKAELSLADLLSNLLWQHLNCQQREGQREESWKFNWKSQERKEKEKNGLVIFRCCKAAKVPVMQWKKAELTNTGFLRLIVFLVFWLFSMFGDLKAAVFFQSWTKFWSKTPIKKYFSKIENLSFEDNALNDLRMIKLLDIKRP